MASAGVISIDLETLTAKLDQGFASAIRGVEKFQKDFVKKMAGAALSINAVDKGIRAFGDSMAASLGSSDPLWMKSIDAAGEFSRSMAASVPIIGAISESIHKIADESQRLSEQKMFGKQMNDAREAAEDLARFRATMDAKGPKAGEFVGLFPKRPDSFVTADADTINEIVRSTRTMSETIGMSGRELDMYRLKAAGATDIVIDHVNHLHDVADAWRANQSAIDASNRKLEEMQANAANVFEMAMSPAAKLQQQVERIFMAFATGGVNFATQLAALGSLSDAGMPGVADVDTGTGPGIENANTALGDFKFRAAGGDGAEGAGSVKENTKKALDHLRAIERNTKASGQVVIVPFG